MSEVAFFFHQEAPGAGYPLALRNVRAIWAIGPDIG